MMTERSPMRTVFAALAITLPLAACGSSSKTAATTQSSAQTTTAAPAATSTVTATTTTATTTSPTTATATATTPVAQSGGCNAPGLELAFLGQQGATGHGELGFALKNTTSQSCRTGGYPGIQFLSNAGAPLPTDATRTTQDFFGSLPNRPLTIAPGASFSFRVGVTHGEASSAGCVTASSIGVIAPNDTVQLRVSIPDGAYECGTATISPVAAGNSAYAGG